MPDTIGMKKKTLTILGILVLALVVIFLYRHFHHKTPPNPYANSNITSSVFETDGGFGYDIFIDGAEYVHQPTIPAVGGNKAFSTKDDAQSVADLAISKIKDGIIPPTITTDELQSLGVVK